MTFVNNGVKKLWRFGEVASQHELYMFLKNNPGVKFSSKEVEEKAGDKTNTCHKLKRLSHHFKEIHRELFRNDNNYWIPHYWYEKE